MLSIRELYHSSNGDRWYLADDSDTRRVFVKHEANPPSRRHIAEIEIGALLSQGNGPDQQRLLRLMATMVGDTRTPKRGAGGGAETEKHLVGPASFGSAAS
jgi:hypothetical protein